MLGVLFAAAILGAASPATGAAPDATKPAVVAPTAAAKGPAQDPNRIVCHSTNLSGSRLVTRKCLTAAAWREQQLRDQQDLNFSQKSRQVMTR
jgi:hypothetical protein